MKKLLTVFLLLVTFLSCSLSSTNKITKQERIESVSAATVALIDDSGDIYCTGVFVSKTTFITAKHCLGARSPVAEFFAEMNMSMPERFLSKTVRYRTFNDYEQNIVKYGREANVVSISTGDLALLQITRPTLHDTATIGLKGPRIGETVDIVGHTLGFGWSYSSGQVSYPSRFIDFEQTGAMTEYIQIFSSIAGGNSGGGVFNERGQLVGITSFMASEGSTTAFVVHVNEIQGFIIRTYQALLEGQSPDVVPVQQP